MVTSLTPCFWPPPSFPRTIFQKSQLDRKSPSRSLLPSGHRGGETVEREIRARRRRDRRARPRGEFRVHVMMRGFRDQSCFNAVVPHRRAGRLNAEDSPIRHCSKGCGGTMSDGNSDITGRPIIRQIAESSRRASVTPPCASAILVTVERPRPRPAAGSENRARHGRTESQVRAQSRCRIDVVCSDNHERASSSVANTCSGRREKAA
jgi:hypothetical protein